MTMRDMINLLDTTSPACLLEASLGPAMAKQTFWHGTNNTSGQKILRDGMVIGAQRPRGKGYIPPLVEGTYLTPQFTYAVKFAYRDNKQKFGWLFGCPGSALIDVEVDEDEIGWAVRAALQKRALPGVKSDDYQKLFKKTEHLVLTDRGFCDQLLSLVDRLIPDDLRNNLMRFHQINAQWLSDAGGILLPHLPLDMKLAMLNAGCHLVHTANLVPAQAWRFDPKAGTDIHNGFLREGIAVLARLAERMR